MSQQARTDLDARMVRETGVALAIAKIAEPVLDDLGFRLVRVHVSGQGNSQVQIMAERPDGSLTIDDCVAISRALSPVLDVEDPISGKYNLEISSPGIDRPLVRPSDYERWAGYEAKIELSQPLAERRRFKGQLEGFADGEVRIFIKSSDGSQENILVGLPFDLISSGKLVMNDDLLKKSQSDAKKRNADQGETGEGSLMDVRETTNAGETANDENKRINK